MKKRLALLLAVCLLLLSGCDTSTGSPSKPNQSDGELSKPIRPAGVTIKDYDQPAITVKLSFAPELELALSPAFEILDVTALNSDAETLLAELDLVGQPYNSGIATILEEATELGFLNTGTKVSITAEEATTGGLTNLTQELLTIPVTEYQKNSDTGFVCQVKTTGTSFNSNQLTLVAEYNTGGETTQEYADGSGVVKKQVYFCADGTVITQYHPNGPSIPPNMTCIKEFPDGTYEYSTEENGNINGYVQYPDGSLYTYVHHFIPTDGEWLNVYSYQGFPDGSTSEQFYDNGCLSYTVSTFPDGRKFEQFFSEEGYPLTGTDYHPDGTTTEYQYFYENGMEVGVIQILPDGSKNESQFFYEGGIMVRRIDIYASGDTVEVFFENGEIVKQIQTLADGTVIEIVNGEEHIIPAGASMDITYYPNGNEKTNNITWPNGDYSNITFYENGNTCSILRQQDGLYEEFHYDENGVLISELLRFEDGSGRSTQYKDGQIVSDTSTDADGNTYSTIYNDDGTKTVEYLDHDGDYSKSISDAAGKLIYQYSTYDDSYIEHFYYYYENGNMESYVATTGDGWVSEATFYSNGNQKTYTSTAPNGDYSKSFYDENGLLTGDIIFHESCYSEYTYDSNGTITWGYQRYPDGLTYDYVYEDGIIIGYTVTYPDGTSEYIIPE